MRLEYFLKIIESKLFSILNINNKRQKLIKVIIHIMEMRMKITCQNYILKINNRNH